MAVSTFGCSSAARRTLSVALFLPPASPLSHYSSRTRLIHQPLLTLLLPPSFASFLSLPPSPTTRHSPTTLSQPAIMSSSSSFKDAEELEQSLRYANDNVQAQLTSELVHSMQDKCFKSCITQPADNLSSREERCLSSCMDKFLSSRQLVAELYAANRQTR